MSGFVIAPKSDKDTVAFSACIVGIPISLITTLYSNSFPLIVIPLKINSLFSVTLYTYGFSSDIQSFLLTSIIVSSGSIICEISSIVLKQLIFIYLAYSPSTFETVC